MTEDFRFIDAYLLRKSQRKIEWVGILQSRPPPASDTDRSIAGAFDFLDFSVETMPVVPILWLARNKGRKLAGHTSRPKAPLFSHLTSLFPSMTGLEGSAPSVKASPSADLMAKLPSARRLFFACPIPGAPR